MKSRRNFLKTAVTGAGLVTLPGLLNAAPPALTQTSKILCIGAHPDDPESGCGGTLAKLQKMGHEVTIIYLTTGEAGIANSSHADSAAIRKQEAVNACKLLNAKPVFAGQIDGETIVSNTTLQHLKDLVIAEKPDIIFTHWPIDSHKDHQVASLLTTQIWIQSASKFSLYFFEVCTGEQTLLFHPTVFVDMGETQEQKRLAVYAHKSQFPESIYALRPCRYGRFPRQGNGCKSCRRICKNGR